MNDICNACYSNQKLGATSRNLNIEDIEAILNISAWNPRTYNYNGYKTYTNSKKDTTYKNYPYIWQYEEYANISGVSATDSRTLQIGEGEGISRSTQPKNPDDEYGYYTQTYNTAQTYIQPTQTGWASPISDTIFLDKLYTNVLKNIGSDFTSLPAYWLSSRAASPWTYMSFHDWQSGTKAADILGSSFAMQSVGGGSIMFSTTKSESAQHRDNQVCPMLGVAQYPRSNALMGIGHTHTGLYHTNVNFRGESPVYAQLFF